MVQESLKALCVIEEDEDDVEGMEESVPQLYFVSERFTVPSWIIYFAIKSFRIRQINEKRYPFLLLVFLI